MIRETRAEIEEALAEADRELDAARATRTSGLEIGVNRSLKSYADVEGAYAAGDITPAKRTSFDQDPGQKARGGAGGSYGGRLERPRIP
ncbi:MAG: hypothetical protein QF511_01895 [Rhodospirillales bacterium]|jgi:predicted aminopeptidase|nr:hypothetical protein [Rhodospirillales bacterium]